MTPSRGSQDDARTALETRAFYERDAETYDRERWNSEAGSLIRRTQLDIVAAMLPAGLGRLVEVGSGTGRFSGMLEERAERLILVDVSDGMLRRARGRTAHAAGLLGDASQLPFTHSSVDGIVCINVLNHVIRYEHAIAEFSRVLRPGGVVILNFNNLSSLYYPAGRLVNRRRRSFRADVFSHWIGEAAFRRALEVVGLQVMQCAGHLVFPTWTPGALLPPLRFLDRAMRGRPKVAPVVFVAARRVDW